MKVDNFEEFLKTLKNRKKVVPEYLDECSEEDKETFIKKEETKAQKPPKRDV